jgi:hypothetical protein
MNNGHEKRDRVLRRPHLAKRLKKTNMQYKHKRHAISTQAVYGDDEAWSLSSDEELNNAAQINTPSEKDVATLRIITLNVRRYVMQLSSLLEQAAPDLCCLQEVTQENHTWLLENCADTYDIRSPLDCGAALHAEGHDIAILWKKETFSIVGFGPWLTSMDSLMTRRTLAVCLAHRETGLRITLATSHFDSGNSAELVPMYPGDTWGDVRRRMLDDAMQALGEEDAEHAVLFAGDFNLQDSEPLLAQNWVDAWCLAGEPEETKPTITNAHNKRYDRLFFFGKQGTATSKDEHQQTVFVPDANSFELLSAKDSDHWAVCCTFCLVAADDRGQSITVADRSRRQIEAAHSAWERQAAKKKRTVT